MRARSSGLRNPRFLWPLPLLLVAACETAGDGPDPQVVTHRAAATPAVIAPGGVRSRRVTVRNPAAPHPRAREEIEQRLEAMRLPSGLDAPDDVNGWARLFARIVGVPVALTPSACDAAAAAPPGRPDDLSRWCVGDAMEAVARQFRVRWRIRDGVIEGDAACVMVTYDLRRVLPALEPPGPVAFARFGDEPSAFDEALERIVRRVRATLEREAGSSDQAAADAIETGYVIVFAPPEAHAAVRRILPDGYRALGR